MKVRRIFLGIALVLCAIVTGVILLVFSIGFPGSSVAQTGETISFNLSPPLSIDFNTFNYATTSKMVQLERSEDEIKLTFDRVLTEGERDTIRNFFSFHKFYQGSLPVDEISQQRLGRGLPIYAGNKFVYIVPNSDTLPTVSAIGSTATPVGVGTVSLNVTGHWITQETTSVVGNVAGLEGSVGTFGVFEPYQTIRFRLNNLAATRFFAGLTSQTLASTLVSDNPGGDYAGVQYSSARGDSTFKCVTGNSTGQTIYDSGVEADLLPHTLKLYWDLLRGRIVCQIGTSPPVFMTSTLPSPTVAMRDAIGISNLLSLVRKVSFGYIQRVQSEGR